MKIPIQVRYIDFDRMGHLNNAAYATYFEIARLNFLLTLFEKHSTKWTDVVANINIDYRKPILPSHKPYVEIFCSRIGNSSYDLGYQILDENSPDTLYAEGKTIQVCIDEETQKPEKLNDAIKDILHQYIA